LFFSIGQKNVSFFFLILKKNQAGAQKVCCYFSLPLSEFLSRKKGINQQNAPSAKSMHSSQICIPQYWILIKDKKNCCWAQEGEKRKICNIWLKAEVGKYFSL
jgi:hypothetical protein